MTNQNSDACIYNEFFSASRAILRWRRLISLSKADMTNCPVLSPVALSNSTSSTIWCGTRTSILLDFALTALVGIPQSPSLKCRTIVYMDKWNARLDVSDTFIITCVRHLHLGALKIAKPGSGGTLTGLLTKPLVEVTVMAVNKHTQTRPKYQYRLLAVSRQDRSVPPSRLCTGAGSEQAVRCLTLSPADPLPVQEVQNA